MKSILKDRLRINGGLEYAPNGSVYGRGIYAGNKDTALRFGGNWMHPYTPIFKCEINTKKKYKKNRGKYYVIDKETDIAVKSLILKK